MPANEVNEAANAASAGQVAGIVSGVLAGLVALAAALTKLWHMVFGSKAERDAGALEAAKVYREIVEDARRETQRAREATELASEQLAACEEQGRRRDSRIDALEREHGECQKLTAELNQALSRQQGEIEWMRAAINGINANTPTTGMPSLSTLRAAIEEDET